MREPSTFARRWRDITMFNNNGVNYSGAIYNLPGALFDFQADRSIGCACYGKEFLFQQRWPPAQERRHRN